mgnify:FL=1
MKKVFARLAGSLKISRVVQFLTYSDIMMLSGWGLINPILAVFISEQVVGGGVELAGMAATVYFVVKSVVQIPVARWNDKRRGERDDYWVMIIGSLLIALSAFLYIGVRYPWQVYAVQIVGGLGGALSYPSWLAIFTRHIDKQSEVLEWSLYYTATDLGAALTAGLGGYIAASFGYSLLFGVVGVSSLLGTAFLAGVAQEMKRR